MDLLIEGKRFLVAKGAIDFKTWNTRPDGFVPRIHQMAAAFAKLRKLYVKFVSDDGKIVGLERVRLVDGCEEVLQAALGALYHGLRAQQAGQLETDTEMTVPGREQAFWVRSSGSAWHLREKLQDYPADSIGERLAKLGNASMAGFLAELRHHAADGQISTDEQALLLPKILDLTLELLALRHHIEVCATSA